MYMPVDVCCCTYCFHGMNEHVLFIYHENSTVLQPITTIEPNELIAQYNIRAEVYSMSML